MRKIDTPEGPRYEMPNGDLWTEQQLDDWLAACAADREPELYIQGAWRNARSEGAAVHPDQCELAEARNKLHGVNVTYDRETGEAIFPDRNERRKLLKVERFHDRDGGYGD